MKEKALVLAVELVKNTPYVQDIIKKGNAAIELARMFEEYLKEE